MDMKKILQAVDGISTKPVEGADSMAKFLRVVKEAEINQPVGLPAVTPIKVPAIPQLPAQDGELGGGITVTTNADGTRTYSSGIGMFTYDAQGKAITYASPRMMGLGQSINLANNQTTQTYNSGPLATSQRVDANGKPLQTKINYNIGTAKMGYDNDHVSGIRSAEFTPHPDMPPELFKPKDMYARGNKDREATYDRAMAQVNGATVQESINKFLRIVDEAALNQPTTKTPPAKPTSDLTADEMAAILSGQKTQAQVMADRAANKKETILDEPVALKVNPNSTNADTDRINNNQPDVDPNAPPGFSDYDQSDWDPDSPDDAEHVKSVEIMRNRSVNGQDTTDYDRYHYSRKNDGKPGVWTKNDQPATVRETMDKFLSIVKKNDVSILNEGANPHKVALPVQMAMQHYQKVIETPQPRERLIDKYFVEAEAEIIQKKEEKRALYNQYAKTIASRVLMKESAQSVPEGDVPTDPEFESIAETPIAMDPAEPNNPTIHNHEKANTMTLKGRIASARAQLKELAELADSDSLLAWEEICKKAKGGMFMGLEQNLEQIRHGISELAAKRRKGGVTSRGIDKHIGEGKRK